jgi:hypothetical protein
MVGQREIPKAAVEISKQLPNGKTDNRTTKDPLEAKSSGGC